MILLPPYDHDQPFVSTTSMAGVAYHYNNYFNDTKQRWPTSTTTTVTTTTISNTAHRKRKLFPDDRSKQGRQLRLPLRLQ